MVKSTKQIRNDNRVKRRIQRLKVIGMFFVIVFICTAINYKTHELKKKEVEYQSTIKDLDKDYAKEKKRTESITKQKAYVQTKQFKEEFARRYYGLVYPDEILFQAEDKNEKN